MKKIRDILMNINSQAENRLHGLVAFAMGKTKAYEDDQLFMRRNP